MKNYTEISIANEGYPKEKGKYFVVTERGEMTVLEWTGEVTIGWRNCDKWLKQLKTKK